jgi:predicted transcriptional regulator
MVTQFKSRRFILSIAISAGISSLFGGLILFASPGDTLSVSKARELLQHIGGANFDKDQVQIKDLSPSLTGGDVIVEARIETAFRITRENGDWRVSEVRLGDRQWESFDLIEEAVRREKVRRTTIMLKELANGLSAYQRERGKFVETEKIEELLDFLSPRHIPTPYRVDLWGMELKYRGKATNYRLVSSGPDRKSGTKDDLVIENGLLRPEIE